jgi:hypothetical protein
MRCRRKKNPSAAAKKRKRSECKLTKLESDTLKAPPLAAAEARGEQICMNN